MENEWNNIRTDLEQATARTLQDLNDDELDKLEVLLDHWHKLARGALIQRREKHKTVT